MTPSQFSLLNSRLSLLTGKTRLVDPAAALSPEDIQQLDDEWRACRRRIDALLTASPVIDYAHISLLKIAYPHIDSRDYQNHYQSILDHHDAVFAGITNLLQLHQSRDHSSKKTWRAYPDDASHFKAQLDHMLSCVTTVYRAIRLQVPPEEQSLMDTYLQDFDSTISELMDLLTQGGEYAKKLLSGKTRLG